ncbi:MAG: TerB family tellurite resistance protein, partial [Mucilaginibacter sp.]|nr:TerB family tellurite resistance protein [Mucilaginibacter sp.]
MKHLKFLMVATVLLCTAVTTQVRAQSDDMVQLILDIEKLTQLKGILTDMKTGNDIINGGYNEVKQ